MGLKTLRVRVNGRGKGTNFPDPYPWGVYFSCTLGPFLKVRVLRGKGKGPFFWPWGYPCQSLFLIACLVLFTLVAINLSSVSLLFIAHCHLFRISSSLMFLSWMTRSHLMVQIKCADSVKIRWKRWVAPCFVMFCCWLVLSCQDGGSSLTLPHPSIIPRFISGQWMFVWGHNPFARSHIRLTTHSLQEISIWSIVSVLWHKGHWALSSNPGMLVQYSLIFCMLCIVLYRNCWIFVLICRFRRPRHMFPLVFCIPLYLRIASFIFQRLLCIVLQK